MSANIGSAGKFLFNTYSTVRLIKDAEHHRRNDELSKQMLKRISKLAFRDNRLFTAGLPNGPSIGLGPKTPSFEEYAKSDQADPDYVTFVHELANTFENYKLDPSEVGSYLLRYPPKNVSRSKYRKTVNQAIADAKNVQARKRILNSQSAQSPYLPLQKKESALNQSETSNQMDKLQPDKNPALKELMDNWKSERALLGLQADWINSIPKNKDSKIRALAVKQSIREVNRANIDSELFPHIGPIVPKRPTKQDSNPIKFDPNILNGLRAKMLQQQFPQLLQPKLKGIKQSSIHQGSDIQGWFPQYSEHYKTAGRLLFDTYLITKLVKNAGNNGRLVDRAKGIWSKWNKTVVNPVKDWYSNYQYDSQFNRGVQKTVGTMAKTYEVVDALMKNDIKKVKKLLR